MSTAHAITTMQTAATALAREAEQLQEVTSPDGRLVFMNNMQSNLQALIAAWKIVYGEKCTLEWEVAGRKK